MIDGSDIFSEIALRRMSLDLSDDKSTLVQLMAWCHQATSHYLRQCWPRSQSPYDVTRPQWLTHWGWDKMVAMFKSIFLNDNSSLIQISLKFVLKDSTDVFMRPSDSLSFLIIDSLCPSDTIWRQEIWVNIGSGNGLLPDGTKPLPKPKLTDHQWNPVTFILGQFHKRCLNHQSLKSVW